MQCFGPRLDRRQFCKSAGAVASWMAVTRSNPQQSLTAAETAEPVAIGSRRELFVDDLLVDGLFGGASRRLHHPVPQEVVIDHDAPWEGTGSGYHSVFQDGGLYRMYYKAWHLDVGEGKLDTTSHPLYCCYAESEDGIHWRKPDLGIHSFRGSKQNNIVIASGPSGPLQVDAGHPAVFRDQNPDALEEARYKAILRSSGPNGLLPFQSPDGLHWSPMTDRPILAGLGAFDSQNLAFWDPNVAQYRAYWRTFTDGSKTFSNWKAGRIRAIRTALSDDLVHWGPSTDLTYVDSPPEELYTNQIKPYARAPHLLLGFPTRYVDRGWKPSLEQLPDLPERRLRASSSDRYGTAITEALLMASRDGTHFTRWNEAFLRPGPERHGSWHYGHQYVAWHLVETASTLPGAGRELSLYASEAYWHGRGSAVRRYTLRLDGFVSIHAPASGISGLRTKPLTFTGTGLQVNFATSAAGSLRVELQDLSGAAIPGYSLDECHELFGDTVDRRVTWRGGGDVSSLQGRPIRIRWVLSDADLYSFQFA